MSARASLTSPCGTGEICTWSLPNTNLTGDFTVAPFFGSTKNTLAPTCPSCEASAAGAAAGASATCVGSERHAATESTRAAPSTPLTKRITIATPFGSAGSWKNARGIIRSVRLVPPAPLFHGPQSHRPAVRVHQPVFPAGGLRAGAVDPVAAGVPGSDPVAASRALQPARRDARHHHGVSRRRPAGGRRVRELPRAAADRRARHGLPAAEPGELVVLRRRRADHAGQLFRSRGRGDVRLDVLSAARRLRTDRPDVLAGRHAVPDFLVAARRAELHHDDRPAPRAWPDLVPTAVLRLGAVHH